MEEETIYVFPDLRLIIKDSKVLLVFRVTL